MLPVAQTVSSESSTEFPNFDSCGCLPEVLVRSSTHLDNIMLCGIFRRFVVEFDFEEKPRHL